MVLTERTKNYDKTTNDKRLITKLELSTEWWEVAANQQQHYKNQNKKSLSSTSTQWVFLGWQTGLGKNEASWQEPYGKLKPISEG